MTDVRYSANIAGPLVRDGKAQKNRPRLLVVDDDRSVCTLVQRFAEKAGFAATCALSFEEAAKCLRTHQFNCITLDLGIGANSGVAVLKVLSEMASAPPIIIISGSKRSMRDFAVGIGKTLHLEAEQLGKPIDFALLKSKLTNIKMKFDAARQRPTEASLA